MKINRERLEHPNPQFVRKKWWDLCGTWDFAFDFEECGIKERWFDGREFPEKIQVPFVYQSSLSGVAAEQDCEVVWYKREFGADKKDGKRLLLHFEAVDYLATVWINGNFVGRHEGGFVPFVLDITEFAATGENTVVVRVEDRTSCRQPLGKQSWKSENFLCWYTRTTGIWRDVWMEEVPETYIGEFYVTPDLGHSCVEIEAYISEADKEGELTVEVRFGEELVNRVVQKVKDGKCRMVLDVSSNNPDFRVECWSPETPHLYELKLRYKDLENEDEVESYFGMRRIHAENGAIYLNNKEFYQKLVLNQGYYGDGLMTPPSVDWLVEDVEKMKAFGFNGVRMHQKIEDNRFAYLCDCCGLVMWAEMPSTYAFDRLAGERVMHEVGKLVKKHYNNPSVIVWTLFNESWGVNEILEDKRQQNFVDSLFQFVKSMDSTRLVIGNDGWEHARTDILSIHDYSYDSPYNERYGKLGGHANGVLSKTSLRKNYADGYAYQGEPVIISECGGIAFAGEVDALDSWGYGDRPKDAAEVIARFERVIKGIASFESVCGFCYTQLTDVEQEINGLLDHGHNYKFEPGKIREILDSSKKGGFKFA
ncbi:sugar-binding domain-containing protein [Anaerotalea alkaliphila]|uniref:Glycoside hydrolase family 2 n=1 Tax=Anaerotalea alkaliphila TaxID=2662126 RepID=A0A7X5KLL4_9FIRM|nr:sugar-binding domain-containing protein [Anaerotalea alkaliphila]NDL66961.1 glycoside hydrolase family 2 [Anaerotalea alkaliphila]